MLRVLVIAECSDRADVVREGLQAAGHLLAEIVAPSLPLRAAIERTRADAIVLQASSPGGELLEGIAEAMQARPVPLLIFSDDSAVATIQRALRAGAAAYVVNNLQAAQLPVILQVALVQFDLTANLRSQLSSAQQKLAERKYVERAKGLLMRSRNLSEDEAYHTLRRMAMERNKRLGDIARSVIEMADLLN